MLRHAAGAALGAPPPPFRDFIDWLRRHDGSGDEAFWKRQLAGFTTPTPLPLPGHGKGEIRKETLHLPHEVTAALESFARANRLTVNTLVQGAFALLLSRYSGQEDLVYGTTFSGRPADLPGAESMVGLFINSLPMRVALPRDTAVLPWLQGLQGQLTELQGHQHTPLASVQAWSDVPSGQELFETLLVFENYPTDPAAEAQASGVAVRDVRSLERSHYPLMVVATPGPRLSLSATHDTARIDLGAARRLLGHLATLLEGLARQPDRTLSEMPLLTGPESEQLAAWGAARVSFETHDCLHALFERQVARTPDAVAVIHDDLGSRREQLTYAGLDAQARGIAARLHALGVRRGDRVGLCVERSPGLIAAILGILKAGGAYVPVEPTTPDERLAWIIEDAGLAALITERQVLGPAVPTVLLGDPQPADAPAPAVESAPGDAAYVIYTSGSTGRPKGVVVEHRHVVRLFASTREWFSFGPADVWTMFHSAAFDFSVWEMWGALLHGGTLVVVPHAISRSPEAFHRLLRRHGVTVLNQTPSAFRQLIWAEESTGARDLALRYVIFGGEALELNSLAPWFER
ncbi:MAG TPA: AMP-binding protein, partial [Myxococcaceae bacterium]